MAFLEKDDRDKCPHCQTVVRFEAFHQHEEAFYRSHIMYISLVRCPNCNNIVVSYRTYVFIDTRNRKNVVEAIIYPISSGRSPAPDEVPDNIAQDYQEACLVFPHSPKASAALARRCLQSILTNYAHTSSTNLSAQIDEVLDSLPTYISDVLDSIRNVGNFAAHEQKSTNTGMILDVEPHEAEWTLDILELLFDFYFVGPAKAQAKKDSLNTKLTEAGKNPMKEP